ncbi:FecCD family ABC transporter permease [Cytophaga aurantiaca]|uniref:FecCD family ABC transporter permease n=1 Tax=Cytophaga aurantiaca TaxID=29530 RepID=UPI00037F541B|nr:iron ABC transporter permease [Cytophaga aurantiaca]
MKKLYIYIAASLLLILLIAIGTTQNITQIHLLPDALIQYNSDAMDQLVWVEIRLPRLLLAFITGAALGLSGYLMQVLVRNPLADPYVLGSSSGASLFAALFFVWLAPNHSSLGLLLTLTFCGALGTNIVSLLLATVKGKIVPYRMILVGIAISSLAISLLSLLLYVAGEDQSWKNIIFWTFGSFQTASWSKVVYMACIVIPIAVLTFLMFNPFQIMELGEENANRLGVFVQRYRVIVLLLSSILTAVAVSMVGPIGFIGLVMPHITRMLFNFQLSKSFILWLCYLSGLFLMLCEMLSTQLFPPQGVPAGILMSLVGVPFFLYLLLKTADNNY